MKGFTLAEVLIATLLVAIMAMGAFSVALTGRAASSKGPRRAAAALAVQRVSETLKGFVTADTALALGPGGAGPNGWGLPGDRCNCYALQAGPHELDPALWLPQLAAAPYSGTISYTVASAATPNGLRPTATFSVAWTEP
ncbi:MAG: prepilin-type N-terminal cleavage/methylation domain-containing protein [Elusimicrobia bacterium]|nr:prepilin-type N-terminal cleavage/methylation domain-containing protein [Elusimicrobiota bacterium]